MLSSNTRFSTENGQKYLDQLCRHFAHKISVEQREGRAELRFSIGVARLETGSEKLAITTQAETPENLAEMRDIVERHLKRFVFREEMPPLLWSN